MEQEKSLSKQQKKRKIFKVIGILFLIGLVLVSSLAVYIFHSLEPYKNDTKKIEVSIPLNSTVMDIAKILKSKGVIRNAKTFYYYARYKNQTDLKAGEYTLSPSTDIDTLLEQLKQGKIIENEYTFTIPEGYTVRQIAALLEEKGFTTKQKFLDALENGNYSDIWLVKKDSYR